MEAQKAPAASPAPLPYESPPLESTTKRLADLEFVTRGVAIVCVIYGAAETVGRLILWGRYSAYAAPLSTTDRIWEAYRMALSIAQLIGGVKVLRRRPAGKTILTFWGAFSFTYAMYLVGAKTWTELIQPYDIFQKIASILAYLSGSLIFSVFPLTVLILFMRETVVYLKSSRVDDLETQPEQSSVPGALQPFARLVGIVCLILGGIGCTYHIGLWLNYFETGAMTEFDKPYLIYFSIEVLLLTTGAAFLLIGRPLGKVILSIWAISEIAYGIYCVVSASWRAWHRNHVDGKEIVHLIRVSYSGIFDAAIPIIVLWLFLREAIAYLKKSSNT
jgi:hypothetical protein